jgi:hypothetical protein
MTFSPSAPASDVNVMDMFNTASNNIPASSSPVPLAAPAAKDPWGGLVNLDLTSTPAAPGAAPQNAVKRQSISLNGGNALDLNNVGGSNHNSMNFDMGMNSNPGSRVSSVHYGNQDMGIGGMNNNTNRRGSMNYGNQDMGINAPGNRASGNYGNQDMNMNNNAVKRGSVNYGSGAPVSTGLPPTGGQAGKSSLDTLNWK